MTLGVTLFTDPACPFAFSAEPARQRLRWHYGDDLAWTVRMIVLTREAGHADRLAEGAPGLQRAHGMPIDPRPYPRAASSEPASRAVVAVREHGPAGADQRLLRALRVRVMQCGLLDDPALLDGAARDAGLEPAAVAAWAARDDTTAALEADAAAARAPVAAARGLDHKLGGPAGARRYTAPSYVIGDLAVPGFTPAELYLTAVANAAPGLRPRPRPQAVAEVLDWADAPLATAEVSALLGRDARADLETSGAAFVPAGADGYWLTRAASSPA